MEKKYQKKLYTADLIDDMRKLILTGKTHEAELIFKDRIRDEVDFVNPYQPFFDLEIHCEVETIPENSYHRSVDMRTAVGTVSYDRSCMECFTSQICNCIMIQFTSEQRKNLEIVLSRPEDPECNYQVSFSGNELVFEGVFIENIRFSAVIHISTDAEKWSYQEESNRLILENTYHLTAAVTMDVDTEGNSRVEQCRKELAKALEMSFAEHKKLHTAKHAAVYDRVNLDIEEAGNEKTTEQLMKEIYAYEEPDLQIYEQYFNACRYFMIATSYGADLPTNLQGLWNHDIAPMWESGYTMDMNVQMAHWMVNALNLQECIEPLYKWITSDMPKLRKRCKDIFGVEGIHIGQYTDVWFESCKCEWAGTFQTLWSGAAAWICQHFTETWKYTGNDQFMLEKAYPFMLECARFYENFLVKNEKGNYILCPSCSPENQTINEDWLVNTATMDIFLVDELLHNLLMIEKHFHINSGHKEQWEEILDNMAAYPIGEDGVMREWVDPVEYLDPGHRHLSHIYGLFPGKRLHDRDKKEISDSVVKAIERRRAQGFGSSSTWSFAWYACCFARLCEGDSCLKSIDDMLYSGMLTNFFTTHNDWRESGRTNQMIKGKLFQLDANLGGAAAIAECFIQSYDNEILILPALPQRWAKGGKITGINGYHGTTFDIYWKNGRVTKLDIEAKSDQKLCIHLPEKQTWDPVANAVGDSCRCMEIYVKKGEKKCFAF